MKIRVLVDFDAYLSGSEFEWDRGLAELLIHRGLIEEVKDEPAPAPKPAVAAKRK